VKFVVCVPDGCADEPVDALGGRTPLEAAAMPNLAALACRGTVGRAAVIPPGMPPGSDVGNLSILGYDPARYHTGRAPIEAAALGLRLRPDQVAFRCNLVTMGEDGTMLDFAGGHPASEQAAPVITAVQEALGGDGLSFHAGVEYRHVLVSDKPAVWPEGPSAARLRELMEAAAPVVAKAGRAGGSATGIWLWGQGTAPSLPPFRERFGCAGALNTAVDLIRGLGVLAGLEVVEAEGVTAGYDTSYEAARDACLRTLAEGADLFVIHVEATDEAGHAGHLDEKVRALEAWDARILGPLVEGLDELGPWRLLLLPDHPTPVARKTHTSEPVPWLLVDASEDGPGGVYSEPATAGCPVVPGHELMGRLVRS
jgi:2,3-bisphosphoglycerate-independent phosphoglycerate mutase